MICILLDIIYILLMVLLTPFVLYRMIAKGRYRRGWKERFGFVPPRSSDQPCIWIHAVSLGEINAIGSLVKQLHKTLPQYEIVISSTTDTGIARAKKLYSLSHQVFFFPLDFSFAVRRAFQRLRPRLCVLMELELWHNFSVIAQKHNIPLVIANGRISSSKGFPRYKKIAPLARPMFRRLSLVLAQDETYAQRFRFLGTSAEKVKVVGLLKYDTAEVTDKVGGVDELARSLNLSPDQMLWVAGSTGPDEEQIILDSFQQLLREKALKKLRLIIVPRKPERFDEVAKLIESRDHRLLRYSQVKAGKYQPTHDDDNAVILGDTLGDLRKFYNLARVIFVGRSLVPMGGSDMMEAAALAKPVVVGPYTENFMETVQKLTAAGAIEIVADGRQLIQVTKKLLLDKTAAHQMAQHARQVILDNKGATARTIEHITQLLN
ncbi:3-deoxy-D-manno-octulosonic acid transferase [Planctomycetota bacterium]